MFNELIYTRCKQGVDILNNCREIPNEGYKVYSCDKALLADGTVDLRLLADVAQTKQTYKEPDFMDDAYLYYTPDVGNSMFVRFSPVHFDSNAKGDYSHRPGNFVNQVFVGDFSASYPCEMFGSSDWDAKDRGEAYYYENPPTPFCSRSLRHDERKYTVGAIRDFIKEGREEALRAAVSFLLSQYGSLAQPKPAKERKFLVIKDDSAENIEKWIAAIEYAFSPQIAATIPFATRMDKFPTANRYTINKATGTYQQQMNLQDTNQEIRYRAMIIGVDSRDGINSNAARALANSPFVLLDGTSKRAMFDSDTTADYYKLITRFDSERENFCMKFLRMVNLDRPCVDIVALYGAYSVLSAIGKFETKSLAEALKIVGFKLANCDMLQKIYSNVKCDISDFLADDINAALQIVDWVISVSTVVGEGDVYRSVVGDICSGFTNVLYKKRSSKTVLEAWGYIKSSKFGADVAAYITDKHTISSNLEISNSFLPSEALIFTQIYLESVKIADRHQEDVTREVVLTGIKSCYKNSDKETAKTIIGVFSNHKRNANSHLFDLAKSNAKDTRFARFIVECILDSDASIIASNEATCEFCKKLKSSSLNPCVVFVSQRRFELIKSCDEIANMLQLLTSAECLAEDELKCFFEEADKNIEILAKSAKKLTDFLQSSNRPRNAICTKSAHNYAVSMLYSANMNYSLLPKLQEQGFVSIADSTYVNALVKGINQSASLKGKWYQEMLTMFLQNPKTYFVPYFSGLLASANKYSDKWCEFFKYVVGLPKGEEATIAYRTIISGLVASKCSAKTETLLLDLLRDKASKAYLGDALECVRKMQEEAYAKSILGRAGNILGGLFKRDKNESDK
ncbi:hypothetical protein AGMMS49975_09890 [Clostridia bacterium]|nr:hypothetical protein AGMMS49975_09890 [Clostridia bacterium]